MKNRGFSLFTAGSREVTAARDCESVKPEETLGWLLELGRAWRVLEGRLRRTSQKTASPKHLRGRAISPKAPRPQTRTTAEPDRSEIGPYLGSSRAAPWGPSTNSASPKHLLGRAISPKAPRPQIRTTAEPDRSEIGPYPGSPQATSGWPKTNCQ